MCSIFEIVPRTLSIEITIECKRIPKRYLIYLYIRKQFKTYAISVYLLVYLEEYTKQIFHRCKKKKRQPIKA